MSVKRSPATEPAQASTRQSLRERARKLVDQVRAYVEYQQSTGLDAFPRRPRTAPPARPSVTSPAPPSLPPAAAVPPPVTAKAAAATSDLFAAPGVRRAATLEELRTELGDCQRCKLAKGRTNIVFGVGNPHAKL